MRAMPRYADVYRQSLENPQLFWARAADDIEWVRRPRAILNASSGPRVLPIIPASVENEVCRCVSPKKTWLGKFC